MSRLTIDISDKQHQALKAMAALQGKTIRQFALEKLFAGKENSDDAAWADFVDTMEQRAAEAMAGSVSNRIFDEIVETAIARAKRVA